MAKITALQETKGRNRVNLFLDGKFAFSLSADFVSSKNLECDQSMTDEEINALSKSYLYQRCLTVATNFLSYRPRSTSELRTKLKRRGFDDDTQTKVLESLRAKGLLDDSAFAEFWTGNRASFSPRSRSLTRIELRKKGVSTEVIERAVESIDDKDSAYRAASGRLRSIRWSDHEQFRRRLGGYLQRRGFGYGVISATLERVWNEIKQQ